MNTYGAPEADAAVAQHRSALAQTVNQVALEVTSLGVQSGISTELAVFATPLKLRTFVGDHVSAMRLAMTQLVAAQTLTDETVRWPASWWDAVKERFAPGWLLQRWPVRYEKRRLCAKALYPGVQVIPGQRHVVVAWVEGAQS